MNEEQAAAEARRRNRELSAERVTDRFWMEIESAPGQWGVRLHEDPPDTRPRWKQLLSALADGFMFP